MCEFYDDDEGTIILCRAQMGTDACMIDDWFKKIQAKRKSSQQRVASMNMLTLQVDFDEHFNDDFLAFSQLGFGVLQRWRLLSGNRELRCIRVMHTCLLLLTSSGRANSILALI